MLMTPTNFQYSVGMALADTLDDLISSRRIEPQLAMRIMQNFDEAVAKVLADKVKARMTFKVSPTEGRSCDKMRSGWSAVADCGQGHLDTYRFCDEVWTFIIKNIHFKMDNQHQFDAEKIKIVACLAKEKAT